MSDCKHGMVEETCSLCRYPRIKDREQAGLPPRLPTRDRRGTGAFAARFDGGKCAGCGDVIVVGEMIMGRPEGWTHEWCVYEE